MRKVFFPNPVIHKGYPIIAFFCAITLFFSPLLVLAEETVLSDVVQPQVTIVEEVQEEVSAVEELVQEEVIAAPEIVEVSPATSTEFEVVEEEQVATTTETTIESATSTETSELLDLILNATTTASSSLNLFEDESNENTQSTTTVSGSTPELMESENDAATSTEPLAEEVKESALVSEVLTPTGYKNISDLTIGDEVVGYDFEADKKVTNVIEKVELITPVHFNYWEQDEEGSYTNYIELPFTSYKVNGHYSLFKDQSVFANGRVVHASQLSVGDIFYTIDGEKVTIETVEEEVSSDQWVKLSVSGNHTYVAGDMILHNASRYWVGGGSSTNWTATGNTNWGSVSNTRDNASVPGASDDVIFDGVGFGASNSTISAAITINSLDMTGYTNTLTHNAFTLTIAGNKLIFNSGMTYALVSTSTSAITFTSTSGTAGSPTMISTAGITVGNMTTSGLGGYFTLQYDLISGGTLSLLAGTFDANNYDVTIGSFFGSNSNARTLTVGVGTWNLTGSNTNVLNFTTITNLSITTRPTYNLTSTTSVGTRTIISSLLPENIAPNINIIGGSDFITMQNAFVGNLDFTGFSGTLNSHSRTVYGDLILGVGMTIASGTNTTTMGATTGTRNITTNGVIFNQNLTINGVGGTFQLTDDLMLDSIRTLTLTSGTFDANGHDVSIGLLFSSGAGVRTLAAGSGTWNFTGSSNTLVNFTTITNFTLATRPTFNFTATTSTGTRGIITSAFPESVAPNIIISAGSDTISLPNVYTGDLDFTGFSGTLTNFSRRVYGNLAFSPTMTLVGGNSAFQMSSTAGTKTITTNGQVLDFPLTIDGVGGTTQLVDNLTLTNTRTLILSNGTFDANGYDVTVGLFSSSGANARTLTVGSGTWNITGSATTIWNTGVTTNFTLTTKPTINLTYAGSVGTRTIGAGTGFAESIIPNFNVTAGTDTVAISNVNLGNLDFTGFSGTLSSGSRTILGNVTFSPTMTVVPGSVITFIGTLGTSTLTTNGVVLDTSITVNGVGTVVQLADDLVIGSTRVLTLTSGTFDANNKNVSIGNFSSSGSLARTLSVGNGTWNITGNGGIIWTTSTNTNLTFTTKPTFNLTYSGSVGTRTVTPSAVFTDAEAPNFNVTAGTDTVSISNARRVGSLNFTGFSGTLINDNSSKTVYGDLILSPTMSITPGSGVVTLGATSGTKVISSAGLTLDFPIAIDGVGGTIQLADDLKLGSTRQLILTNGTFDANNFDVTIGAFSSSNSNARTVNMGSGTWTLQGTQIVWNTEIQPGLIMNPDSSTLLLAGVDQYIKGSNNFFNFTKIATSSDSLSFDGGRTQNITGTLTLHGASSSESLTLGITGTGEQWNINPQGARELSYLEVKRSNNTNPVFIAAYNAPGIVDLGNNTGWDFTEPVFAPASVARTSTVTGGSSAPVVRSLPDSFITSTPEGLQIAPYETEILETIKNNPTPQQYVFTENAFAEVVGGGSFENPDTTQVFEEVQVDTVENIKNVSTTTVVETEEVSDSQDGFMELGAGILGLILLALAFFRSRILNLR